MSRLDDLVFRLRKGYPNYPVAMSRYQSPDDASITHFIHVLCVPLDQLSPVSRRAWDTAFDVFGCEPIPFLLTAIDCEHSVTYFADALARVPDVNGPRSAPER